MDMGMSSTTTAASATPTGAMMDGGMDDDMGMGMGAGGMCKISVRNFPPNRKYAATRADSPS